jgi:hypothetical protein
MIVFRGAAQQRAGADGVSAIEDAAAQRERQVALLTHT